MPTYRLGNEGPVRVPRATCELKLVVTPACAHELVVSSQSKAVMGREDGVLPQRDGTTVIRPVAEGVTISLQAPPTQVFPAGTKARAFLSFHTERGRDMVQVQVQPLDIGGLRGAALFGMHPNGDQYQLEAVGMQPPSPLTAGTEASAYVVRRLHGGASVDRRDTSDLAVLLDDSPSMSPWWSTGALLATLEALAGIDHELGSRDALDVALASDGSWSPVRSDDFAQLLSDTAPAGPRLELSTVSWPDRSHRLVISDTVPQPVPDDITVLLLCEPSAANQLLAMSGETTVVTVPGGSHDMPSILGNSNRRELESFVKAVLDVLRQPDEREV